VAVSFAYTQHELQAAILIPKEILFSCHKLGAHTENVHISACGQTMGLGKLQLRAGRVLRPAVPGPCTPNR
jgi:hypothetical protein